MEQSKAEIDRLSELIEALKEQLASAQKERDTLVAEVNRKQTKIYLLEDLEELQKQTQKQYEELEERAALTEAAYSELQITHANLTREHQNLESTLARIFESRSWRITAPLRKWTEKLGGASDSKNE